MKWEGMDWIYLAQERSQLWALVNMVMNSPVLSRKFIVKLISYFRFSRTPFQGDGDRFGLHLHTADCPRRLQSITSTMKASNKIIFKNSNFRIYKVGQKQVYSIQYSMMVYIYFWPTLYKYSRPTPPTGGRQHVAQWKHMKLEHIF